MLRFDCSPTISQYQRPAMSLCPSVSSVCFCFFFSLPISVFVCLPARLSVCLSHIHLFRMFASLYPRLCLPACLSVCLSHVHSFRLSVSIFVSACLLVCLSICLSVCYESKECDGRATPWTIDTRTFKYRMRDS